MPKPKLRKKIEIGDKFGKLTVSNIDTDGVHYWIFLKCECDQAVIACEPELRYGHKTSCRACTERKDLKKFNPGEIVIFKNAIGNLPFGAQAIVHRIISTEKISAVEIEYRGKLSCCIPSELEKLGINF